jgi:hypothetical protein
MICYAYYWFYGVKNGVDGKCQLIALRFNLKIFKMETKITAKRAAENQFVVIVRVMSLLAQ